MLAWHTYFLVLRGTDWAYIQTGSQDWLKAMLDPPLLGGLYMGSENNVHLAKF